MNRTERDFRRTLTRRVRAVVQASPELRDEWQRRRLSLRRLIIIGGAVAFCALFAILAVPFGIGHVMLYPHVARLFGTGEGVLIPSPDYALTPTTLAVTGGVLLAIAFGPFVLGPGQSLWRKAHFPLSDRQLMWHRLGLLAIIAALCTVCFTPVYVGIITFEKLWSCNPRTAWQSS